MKKSRRRFTPEQKAAILREHLLDFKVIGRLPRNDLDVLPIALMPSVDP